MVDNQQWSAPSLEQAVEIAQGILPREFHSWDEVPGRSGLLPTPTVSDTNGPGTHGDGGADLRTAVSLLPTPTAMDAKASGGSTPSDVTLTDAVVRTSLGATTNPRFDGGKP